MKYKRDHADQRHSAAQEQNLKIDEQGRTCVFAPNTRVLTCEPHSEKSEGGEKYTHYDLQAQQDMAELAFAMLLVSLLGVFVTSAATYYVAMTLDASKRAVLAAEKANETARDIGEAQVRAYLRIAAVKFGVSGFGPLLAVKCLNAGNSPARNVEVCASFRAEHRQKTEFFKFDIRFGLPDVPSKEDRDGGIRDGATHFSHADWGDAWQDLRFVSANIAIFADDVFGKEIVAFSQKYLAGMKVDWTFEAIEMAPLFEGVVGEPLERQMISELRSLCTKRRPKAGQ